MGDTFFPILRLQMKVAPSSETKVLVEINLKISYILHNFKHFPLRRSNLKYQKRDPASKYYYRHLCKKDTHQQVTGRLCVSLHCLRN